MKIDSLPSWITLEEVQGGHAVTYRGRRLTAAASPRLAAEKKAARFTILPNTVIIVPSPLLFNGVMVLVEMLPENCFLLFLENNDDLRNLGEQAFPSELREDSRIHPRIIGTTEELWKVIDTMPLHSFRRVQTVSLTGGYRLAPEVYRNWETTLRGTLREYWRNRATLTVMGRLWIENLMMNIPLLASGLSLTEFQTPKPIILAGAGESLEHSLPFLKETRRKYFLLAADTALPILLEAGVTPDLVVVVESQHANLGDFLSSGALDVPCLFDITSYPGLIRKHRGPRGFFLSRFEKVNLWEQMDSMGILPPVLPPLGSVGLAALYLALSLTANQILFTGLDFCFRPGKTHARGAPSHRKKLSRIQRLDPVISFAHGLPPQLSRHKNRREVMVLSSPNLLGYHDLLGYFRETGRVWDMGSCSLPSCLPEAKNPAALLNDLSPLEGVTIPPPEKKALRAFLTVLVKDLQDLRQWGYQWLKGDRKGETEERLIELLSKHDFLYAAYPDASPLPKVNEIFIKRVLVTTARCLGKINRG